MTLEPSVDEAEAILGALAESFLARSDGFLSPASLLSRKKTGEGDGPGYEARNKALIDHIPGVIFVAPLDYGSGDAYVSPQIETILGFTQEEWLADPLRWYQQVHSEDKLRWSIEAAALFSSGQPLSSTYRVMARDGRVVWFQCDARMVHSGDGTTSFIHGIGFDVSELKEAEASLTRARDELEARVEERTRALAQTNAQLMTEIAEHKQTESLLIAAKEAAEMAARVKGEFMANMSHEIRTPMNGVLGLTSLVLNTELTADQRQHLSLVHSSAESLLNIINQVLDFSKIESGKSNLLSAAFCLRNSIQSLINEATQQARQKGLDLTYWISPESPDYLVGDLGRLRQVLTNLIANAIKFTPAGRVRLAIDLDRSFEPTQQLSCALRFSVTDTGIGIPALQARSIFEPFVQADGSTTRQYGGTGLGLTISKQLVEMMGGRIDLVSEPGVGSTFSFTVCLKVAPDGTEVRSPEPLSSQRVRPPTAAPNQNSSPLKILVAEDNLVNQILIMGVMEQFGHIATLARDGQEALEAYGNSPFDVVLMDVQMPRLDGLLATKAIRVMEAQKGISRLPIIGLSAHALTADRTRCIEAGMDSYLSKPFKASELMLLIKELVARENG